MATAALIEPCLAYRVLDRLLEPRFGHMMAAFSPCAWITRAVGGWENVLPPPGRSGVRVFPCKSIGQIDLSVACGEVFRMDQFRARKLALQCLLYRLRQHCHPVWRALRITDRQVMRGDIDILDAETDACHEA